MFKLSRIEFLKKRGVLSKSMIRIWAKASFDMWTRKELSIIFLESGLLRSILNTGLCIQN